MTPAAGSPLEDELLTMPEADSAVAESPANKVTEQERLAKTLRS